MAIGPSVGQCCYEVDSKTNNAVTSAVAGASGAISRPSGSKYYLNLQAANRLQAIASGVREVNIEVIEECTCCKDDKYFSWRRNRTTGRQGGFIGLP